MLTEWGFDRRRVDVLKPEKSVVIVVVVLIVVVVVAAAAAVVVVIEVEVVDAFKHLESHLWQLSGALVSVVPAPVSL